MANKTIAGLSSLSSAYIKSCYLLPIWDSDASITKNSCIGDIVSSQSPYQYGTGTCSAQLRGTGNNALGNFSNIGGGCANSVLVPFSSISGGESNQITCGFNHFIGGGCNNTISQVSNAGRKASVIGGGMANTICGGFAGPSVIGGGYLNKLSFSAYTFIGAGWSNVGICAQSSFLGGGDLNTITNLPAVRT